MKNAIASYVSVDGTKEFCESIRGRGIYERIGFVRDDGLRAPDLGGKAKTKDFTRAVIKRLK